MARCAICGTRSTQGIKTSMFPKDDRRTQWIAAVRALDKPNWNPTKNSVLCEVCFIVFINWLFTMSMKLVFQQAKMVS
ncbi:hypothetical protein ALC57_14248 [Trachymyrmex cornetzi]|uniref:THAP-type domain-containing protein n=1 Tax=Trachymyrmex cornetzi TaxID=471704 RepID=A0A195DL24_9HYME|nr:hypothetical protein ALC57_14248 [Trachymyrmex cornetzi]